MKCPQPIGAWPNVGLALVLAALGSSCFTSRLGLRNETPTSLVPYPVVVSPPPPHREADPAAAILPGEIQEIDTEGFNPLYYASGITDPLLPNALFVGLDLYDSDPLLIQWRIFHYKVPPGQEGSDPSLQPILLNEEVVEVADEDLVMRLIEGPFDQPPFIGWRVEIVPAP